MSQVFLKTAVLFLVTTCTLAEPLTLREAALESLSKHPSLDVAHYSVEIQRARFKQLQAPFYPTVLGRSGFSRNQASSQNNLSSSVSAVQTLADFGKRRNNSKEQELLTQASQYNLDATAQGLISQVAIAFLALNRDQQLVGIQEANVRWSNTRLIEADSRALDQTLAKSDLSAAQLSLLNAKNARKISQVQLGNTMGRKKAYLQEVAAAFFEVPSWSEEHAQQMALQHRPQVLSARAQRGAAHAATKAARAGFRPTVNAVGSYGFQNLGLSQELNLWNLGVELSIPIFNQQLLSGGVDQAKAAKARQEAVLRALELSVTGEVNQSLVNTQQTQLQVYQNQRNVLGAYHTFIETWAAYRAGRGDARDVSNAQRDLVASQATLVSTAFAHQQAILALYLDTGQLSLEVLPDDPTPLSHSINRYLSPKRIELPDSGS